MLKNILETLLIMFALGVLLALPIYFIWNWIFDESQITFYQALVLAIVSSVAYKHTE